MEEKDLAAVGDGAASSNTESVVDELADAQDGLTEEQQAAVARGDLIIDDGKDDDFIDPALLAAVAGEPDQPAKKDDAVIPRARFNEVNEENKALKAQIEALQAGLQKPVEEAVQQEPLQHTDVYAELEGLYAKAEEARYEDPDQVPLIQKEITALTVQIAKAEAKAELECEQSRKSIVTEFAEAQAAFQRDYPELDTDPRLSKLVNMFYGEAVAAGARPGQAVAYAVAEVNALRGVAADQSAAVKESVADVVRATREKAALEKAAATSVAQPGMLPSKSDKSEFAVDVKNLSAAQMKSLSEDQKARLRGDIL